MMYNPNQESNYRLGRLMIGGLVAKKWSQLVRGNEELTATVIPIRSTWAHHCDNNRIACYQLDSRSCNRGKL